MEKFFKLKEHNTTVKTEIMAGMTTFLTMAYILAAVSYTHLFGQTLLHGMYMPALW